MSASTFAAPTALQAAAPVQSNEEEEALALATKFGFYPTDDYQIAIMRELKNVELPSPVGYYVLLAIFKRPEKTRGGIILADRTRDEDDYQGRVGLVLAIGDHAYRSDKFREFDDPWVDLGDWVVFPVFENAATKFKFNGITLATLPDDKMLAVVDNPMDVF